ncbi:MAG: class II aldolase/adducin family protein [Clostridiales Family XIII bacterium]|nr:class II aldolase/adducin family protein [Clostridiales Family XIII bacterium]
MTTTTLSELRLQMCDIAGLLWRRRLTNAYGGNFCARVSADSLLVTPSLMAEEKHCRLVPDDLMLVDLDGNIIEGTGRLSRETHMHTTLLRAFPTVNAVIHAHPMNGMVFAAAERPIPSVTEATELAGEAGLIEFAPMCTPEMSAATLAYFESKRALAEKMPIAGILPRHGLVVTGQSLNKTFTMLELVETDAYCALHWPK